MRAIPISCACLSLFLAACGGKEPATPLTPDPTTPSTTGGTTPDPAASADAEDRGESPAGPRKRKPFDIHSACGDIVTVVFAEDPKASGAGRRTIAPSSSIDAPRDDKGNQTVWLLDDKGEPLVKVHVTRGMKHVEVGRSCRTLDAR